LVIADHAETLGTIARLMNAQAPEVAKTKSGKYMLELAGKKTPKELLDVYSTMSNIGSGIPNDSGLTPMDLVKDLHGENIRQPWYEHIDTADAHNEPGKFTAMIGWEWTSQPGGKNLHRVIFTPDNAEKARKYLPFSTLESSDPEKLWEWLAIQEEKVGTEFLAIPHNPNISGGTMFSFNRLNGKPIDREYAETKMKYEKSIEITQIKGDSETLPMFSPDDQFADFETFQFQSRPDGKSEKATKNDYVRAGLRNGLQIEEKVGVNPYKIGFAAGTDSHVGIPAIAENNFGGKSGKDDIPEKRSKPSGIGASVGWDMGAAGFTAVWATENNRREIFESFRRNEIYASTGPRITLRSFAGFDLNEDNLNQDTFVEDGYTRGVPMGGDIKITGKNKAPGFTIAVSKDPRGANLDRVQMIKGWINKDGSTSEKVYDVALSDGRTSGDQLVGNTVDLETAMYTNDIGEEEFRTFWRDPDFDADQSAFYYIRVLEIPTPRHSLYDSIALGIDVKETGRPATIQERVYGSPFWYSPNEG
ncbi:hypothetical protein ACH42_02380, partial [Endozoicomonas sp. (ex Bugula neritina AB1)]